MSMLFSPQANKPDLSELIVIALKLSRISLNCPYFLKVKQQFIYPAFLRFCSGSDH